MNGDSLIKLRGLLLWSITPLRFYDFSLFIPRWFPSCSGAVPLSFRGSSLLIPRLLPSYSQTVPLLFQGGSHLIPRLLPSYSATVPLLFRGSSHIVPGWFLSVAQHGISKPLGRLDLSKQLAA